EYFENTCGPKLIARLDKSDSLYVVYKEIMTVIRGSLHAVRSSGGYLTRTEYVSGHDSSGQRLAELRDSSIKEESVRSRIYDAFELYEKFKATCPKYDRVDPVRSITQRAKKFRRQAREAAFQMLSAVFIDEVQDLLPAEILLLRLFCQSNTAWVFAGDTAQTISKGVDFRFESIRRLFYEEFLAGKDWEEDKVHVEVESCSFCKKQTTEDGGVRMECNSHFVAHNKVLCGKEACRRALEKQCEDALKGASAGGRKKAEWAQARSRLSCPLPGCGMYMKETSIAPAPTKDEGPSSSSSVAIRPSFGSIPGIHHLTFNHRSTRGILELAASVIDLLVKLFPEKIDQLPREVSSVDVALKPVFICGVPFEETL
ncbi:TRANK1, partial [Symbiodinium sp. KB8]